MPFSRRNYLWKKRKNLRKKIAELELELEMADKAWKEEIEFGEEPKEEPKKERKKK
jgi:hypothetical protein